MAATDRSPLAVQLLQELPDLPRHVDVRGMLFCGLAEISGGRSAADGFVARVFHGARSSVAVIGTPPAEVIAGAVAGMTPMTPVVAQADNAAHVQSALNAGQAGETTWQGEAMIVHRQPVPPRDDGGTLRDSSARVLTAADNLAHLPRGLRHEITHARDLHPVAAVIRDRRPVSFCYPCWITESLWDVSIDTLEGFRGQQLGSLAFRRMCEVMAREGRTPVWSALDSNVSSLRLAAKLGFEPVDRIVVFSTGAWAFLTAGFDFSDPAGV